MVDLAKLVVKMEADSARLQKDVDKANRRLDSFGKKSKNVASVVKKAFAGIAAGFAVAQIFKATQEAERASRQLENALRRTGNAVGFTQGQLEDFASSLQKVTTVGDEEIIKLQSQLMSFGNIVGEQFTRTIKTVLDFSEVTGRDASTAMRTLAVAINDPLNGMSRLRQAGISLTDSQQQVIKSLAQAGDMAGAQSKLLDALDEAYGGAAEAARNTLGGALQSLRNAFGDLMEAKSGLPGATDEINRLTATLQEPATVQAFDAIASGIIQIGRAAVWVVNAVAEMGRAIAFVGIKYGDRFKELDERFDPILLEQQVDEIEGRLKGLRESKFKEQLRQERDALLARARMLRETGMAQSAFQPNIPAEPDLNIAPSLPTRRTMEQVEKVDKAVKGAADRMDDLAKAGQRVFEQTRTPLENLNIEITDLNELLDEGKITWDTYARAVLDAQDKFEKMEGIGASMEEANETLIEQTQELDEAAQSLGWTFQSAFEDAIIEGENLRTVVQSLIKDMARIALRKSFTEKAGGMFGSWVSGLFDGFRADGGSVSAGKAYVVGEQGPELFMPNTGGTIIPNGGGGGVSVAYNIDARGADAGAVARIERVLKEDARTRSQQIRSEVNNALSRGALAL